MRDLRGQLEAQRPQGLFRSATSALLPNAKPHVPARKKKNVDYSDTGMQVYLYWDNPV